jgi:nucleoside-diphosphate kinase
VRGAAYPRATVKNRTFVMCKPDAVERGLVGEIVARLERKGLTLVAADLRIVDRDLAERHYDEHRDKPFFGDLVDFITRSPVFPMVVEGPDENTWLLVRKLVGATKVTDAEPGTIRGDLATVTTENLVHASDGHESAAREIGLWFPGLG